MSTDSRTSRSTGREDKSIESILEIARFEGERRLSITGVLAVVFALFGGMFIALAPNIISSGAYEDILGSIPPAMQALVGLETFSSVEGVVSGEYYTFTWVVGLGGYLAYSAAGSVAGDLKNDRMDTLLAAPISRTNVLLGKFLGLLVPVVVLNIIAPLVLYVGSIVINMPISLADLMMLHLLSLPYLLCWGAVGLLAGVVVRRGRTAGRVAVGVVVASWLVESVVVSTDFEWFGAVSPMWYFDPPAVLVDGTYDIAGAGLLFVVTAIFLFTSQQWFQRRDL